MSANISLTPEIWKEDTMSIEIPITDSNGYWYGRIVELIELASRGSPDQQADAMEELRRMARSADECATAQSDLDHTTAELDAIWRQHDVARNRRLHLYVAIFRGLEELGLLPAPAVADPEPEDGQNEQYKHMVQCRDQLIRELRAHARCDHGRSDSKDPLLGDAQYVLTNIQRWIDEFEYPFIAWCARPGSRSAKGGSASPDVR